MNYYVYVICDYNKPGRYKYKNVELGLNLNFNYEPVYAARGNLDRDINAYRLMRKKFNLIPLKEIVSSKIDISKVIKKVYTDLNLKNSKILEKNVISTIGRLCDKSGPLTNIRKVLTVDPKKKLKLTGRFIARLTKYSPETIRKSRLKGILKCKNFEIDKLYLP